MMVGICAIASYIPDLKKSNYNLREKFNIDDDFIENKIGVKQVSRKNREEEASDLCVKAFGRLEEKFSFDRSDIDCLVVITQNPDSNLPQVSSIVHGILDLSESCASFDVSLGCSGYVYGLSIIESFMEANGFKNGVLFTADPYSKIINPEDKNTTLLFGDAATATFIGLNPIFTSRKFNFGTIGKDHKELICSNTILSMNGRAIFNFAAKYVPIDVKSLLIKNNLEIDQIDKFVFHQGSKYIIDTISKRLNLEREKVPFDIVDYGNTVSSSIPIILEKMIDNKLITKIVLCGFGVGLSWSSTVIVRV